jgi:Non-histone chromosomal protein MC1
MFACGGSGRSLGQAALRKTNKGIKDIQLREPGTRKVHIFIGEHKQVKKPASAPTPEWMPAQIFIGEHKQVKKSANIPSWSTTKIFVGERKP